MPRSSNRWPGVFTLAALAGVILVGPACRATPGDCRFESTERCLWEAGVAPPAPLANEETNPEYDGELDDPSVLTDRTQLDETLTQMISIIGAGLEWPLVDARARALCSGELSEPRQDPEQDPERSEASGDAWICGINALEINDQPLTLEASDGVLSLTAVDIDDAQSAELFAFAQQRFAGWCAGDPLKHFAGEGLQEFYRCSLPEGPYLIVARFPRELEAGRWQVSIAIVDAG